MRKFDEIFRKDVSYDHIKSHKKPGFHLLFRRYIFRKAVLGLNNFYIVIALFELMLIGFMGSNDADNFMSMLFPSIFNCSLVWNPKANIY